MMSYFTEMYNFLTNAFYGGILTEIRLFQSPNGAFMYVLRQGFWGFLEPPIPLSKDIFITKEKLTFSEKQLNKCFWKI